MTSETKVVTYRKGTTVVVQNQPNQGYFYIVRKGTLGIDSEHRLSDKNLSIFEEGDSFGLVSALTGHTFLVTIYANTDSELLQIPINNLGTYLKSNYEIARKIMGIYIRELKLLQKHLSRVNVLDAGSLAVARLFDHAKTYLSWDKPQMAAHAYQTILALSQKEQYKNELAHLIEDAKSELQKLEPFEPLFNENLKTLEVKPGGVIFLENEPGEEVYVITKGQVELIKIVRGHEYIVDELDSGEIFGEMSFIEHSVRMASAVSGTGATVLRLAPEDLLNEIGAVIMQKVFESLARRIWFSHQRLIILKIENPVTRLYALLYNMIRDKSIKKRTPNADTYHSEQIITTTLDNLKTMCGLLKIKDESIKTFLVDNNIEIQKNQIIVRSRKRLEEKLIYFKTKSGQIASDLV
ncbi:MAG: cyclic nucleotide-binding domain-containing protein [Leptospiraceae bacterium]|nr:cyclic nucleotide-binding domain-containing protein [Leptospiraceae bacterium]MCB1201843.1 cyclic nucleotide-binding domain-containing protein [Leptospiraceae bacterium]